MLNKLLPCSKRTVKTWHHPLAGLIIKRTSCLFLQMVSLLLSKGANARAKDKKERQAIHWAAYQGKCCHTLSLIWFPYEKEQIRIREHLRNTFAITCFVILTLVWKRYIMYACMLGCAWDNYYCLMYWSQYCWQFCYFNKQKVKNVLCIFRVYFKSIYLLCLLCPLYCFI